MSDILDNETMSGGAVSNKPLPNATACLVLGIISICTCWLYGIFGIILGIIGIAIHAKDKRIYQSNPAAYEASYKTSRAGFICSIIGLSISALIIILVIVALVALFSTGINSFR